MTTQKEIYIEEPARKMGTFPIPSPTETIESTCVRDLRPGAWKNKGRDKYLAVLWLIQRDDFDTYFPASYSISNYNKSLKLDRMNFLRCAYFGSDTSYISGKKIDPNNPGTTEFHHIFCKSWIEKFQEWIEPMSDLKKKKLYQERSEIVYNHALNQAPIHKDENSELKDSYTIEEAMRQIQLASDMHSEKLWHNIQSMQNQQITDKKIRDYEKKHGKGSFLNDLSFWIGWKTYVHTDCLPYLRTFFHELENAGKKWSTFRHAMKIRNSAHHIPFMADKEFHSFHVVAPVTSEQEEQQILHHFPRLQAIHRRNESHKPDKKTDISEDPFHIGRTLTHATNNLGLVEFTIVLPKKIYFWSERTLSKKVVEKSNFILEGDPDMLELILEEG